VLSDLCLCFSAEKMAGGALEAAGFSPSAATLAALWQHWEEVIERTVEVGLHACCQVACCSSACPPCRLGWSFMSVRGFVLWREASCGAAGGRAGRQWLWHARGSPVSEDRGDCEELMQAPSPPGNRSQVIIASLHYASLLSLPPARGALSDARRAPRIARDPWPPGAYRTRTRTTRSPRPRWQRPRARPPAVQRSWWCSRCYRARSATGWPRAWWRTWWGSRRRRWARP
jgi:hypothetical protein